MTKTISGLLVGIIVAIIATTFVQKTALAGAQEGGSGIRKQTHYKALLDPEGAKKDTLPFSLLIGGVAGLIGFGITYAIVPKSKA